MQESKKFKTTLIIMSIVVCCFLLIGIIQTFVLNAKNNELDGLKDNNSQLEQEYNYYKQIHDYMCTRTDEHDVDDCMINNNYLEEYYKMHGYGGEDDKIIN